MADKDLRRDWTTTRSDAADEIAPDGGEVRLLGKLSSISTMEFTLPGLGVSHAVRHRTVDEVWYVLDGIGEVWRTFDDAESITDLRAGISVAIPLGTTFQFRSTSERPLRVHASTVPPWPGQEEGEVVVGPWTPNASSRSA